MLQPSYERLVESVSRGPLFSGLDEGTTKRLISTASVRRCGAGEAILCKGRPDPQLHVIGSGRVKIIATASPDQEAIVGIIGPGEFVGEAGVARGQRSCVTAVAMSRCEFMCFSQPLLAELFVSTPQFAMNVLEGMHERLQQTVVLLESKAFFETSQRLARFVQSLADKYGASTEKGLLIEHGLSQATLGQAIGAARETVNKQLREWQGAGIVDVTRGAILVRDSERLKGIAR